MSKGEVARIGHDPDALEAFYREHLDAVRKFVARRAPDAHSAADLTADVFLAAVEASGNYRPRRGSPRAWLLGIARNVVADEFRRRMGERRTAARLAGHRFLDEESTARILERLDAQRQTRMLYAALSALPTRDRMLMELVAIDGLPVAEAAALMKLTPGAARVRFYRCRQVLKAHLAPPLINLKEGSL